MPQLPPEIGIADLIRAAEVLNAQGDELAEIATQLGFTPAPQRRAASRSDRPTTADSRPPGAMRAEPPPGPRRVDSTGSPPGTIPEPAAAPEEQPSFVLEPRPPIPRPQPAPSRDIHELVGTEAAFEPADPTLFTRRHQRAILTAAVTAWDPVGPIDSNAIVERVARGRPLTFLPRVPLSTQRRGAQVLLDVGEGMQPFLEDLRRIEEAMRHTLGPDALQIRYFAGCPTRGAGEGPPPTWKSYAPPRPGVPVLVISDFGMAAGGHATRPATVEEWKAFVNEVTNAGCPITAWTPFPTARHPEELTRVLPIVTWQRSTTAMQMRRAVETAWRRL